MRQVFPDNGKCVLTVQRSDLFKTSFYEVLKNNPADLRKRLEVRFVGEGIARKRERGGVGGGGGGREQGT